MLTNSPDSSIPWALFWLLYVYVRAENYGYRTPLDSGLPVRSPIR